MFFKYEHSKTCTQVRSQQYDQFDADCPRCQELVQYKEWQERDRLQAASYYNTTNFPVLVAHHGNWDIYRNDSGHCAAIPIPSENKPGGCRASHFGDMAYLKHVPDLVYV